MKEIEIETIPQSAPLSSKEQKWQNETLPSQKGIYMEEAICKTNFGLFNYILVIVSGMTLNVVTMEICGVAYIIPVAQCDLSMGATEKGILGAVAPFGIICSSHLWGYLADTKGRRCIILPTLFLAFLFTFVGSFVENFYLFATLKFFNGFFLSASSAAIYAYLSEFHGDARRSQAIMASGAFFGISCLSLPLLAWLVINQDIQYHIPIINLVYNPWRLYMVILATPGLIAAFMLIFLPESPKFVLGQGDKATAYQILKKMHSINNGKHSTFEEFEIYEEADSIESRKQILKSKETRFPLITSVWIQTTPLFKRPYLFITVLTCTIQFGINIAGTGLYMFFADVLNHIATNLDSFTDQRMMMCDAINIKPINISAIQTTGIAEEICITKIEVPTLEQEGILQAMYGLGALIISLLINRVGKFAILAFIMTLCGTGGFTCMLTDIPILHIAGFIALMCVGTATNVVNAATVDLYPTTSRAMAVFVSLMFGRLGGVVGSNISAFLLDSYCEAAFYLAGSSLFVVGILAYFIPGIHNKPAAVAKIQ